MRPNLVCLAGPPGSGKSTLASRVAASSGGSIFRLREAFQHYGDAFADESHVRADELGWRSDEAVRLVLEAAAAPGSQFAIGPHPVILDNFPGNINQLALIDRVARRSLFSLCVLELTLADQQLVRRVRDRRVCPRCHPDPHHPAAVMPGDIRRCADCGSPVIARDTDVAGRHEPRLRRYRRNLRDLGEASRLRGIPYRLIDAAGTVDAVFGAACHAFSELAAEPTPVSVPQPGANHGSHPLARPHAAARSDGGI